MASILETEQRFAANVLKTYQAVLLGPFSATTVNFTAGDIDTGTSSINVANTFVVDTRVQLTGLGSAGIPAGRRHYIVQQSPIQISSELGGSALAIPNAADGSIIDLAPISTVDPDQYIQSVSDLVRYEIANYNGVVSRPEITLTGSNRATFPSNRRGVKTDPINIVVNNTQNNDGAVTIKFIALIENGSTTPGNTTGEVQYVIEFPSAVTINAGATGTFSFEIGQPFGVQV